MSSRLEHVYRIPPPEKVVCEYEDTFETYFKKLKDVYYLSEQIEILDAIHFIYPRMMRVLAQSEVEYDLLHMSTEEIKSIEHLARKAGEQTNRQQSFFIRRLYQNEYVMNAFMTPEETKGRADLEEAVYSWNQIIEITKKDNVAAYDRGVRYAYRLKEHVDTVLNSLPYFGIQPAVCSFIPLAFKQEAYHSLFSQEDTP